MALDSSIFRTICGALFAVASFSAYGVEPLAITAPSPVPVGFAGRDLEIPVQVRNTGGERIDATLSTRLWQQSSSTLMPLAPAQDWWRGPIEGKATVNVPVRVQLPEVRTLVRFRLQVLHENGASIAHLPVIVIPPEWFTEKVSQLPGSLAIYDPEEHFIPTLRQLRASFQHAKTMQNAVDAGIPLSLLIPKSDEVESALQTARERAKRGEVTAILTDTPLPSEKEPAVLIRGPLSDYTNLSESAGAQYRFVEMLAEAGRRKKQAASEAIAGAP